MQTTPEELACLAGGPARAAEVALARLLDAGQVRISREGFVTAVQPGHPTTPLEARILNDLRHGGSFVPDLVSTAATGVEAASLRTHLIGRGLLRRRRSIRPRLYPWLFTLAAILVLAGIAGYVVPDVVDEFIALVPQVADLPRWSFFAAAGVLFVWAIVLGARDPGRMRTRRAYRLVNRAERHVSSTRGPALGTPQYRLNAVAVRGLRSQAALFGLTALAIGVAVHHTNSSSSCGSGCSSSGCGSSDGGGSDGGSSCGGGCGGGGGD